jgi:hypothetical protein
MNALPMSGRAAQVINLPFGQMTHELQQCD